jgi:hypothetical protein
MYIRRLAENLVHKGFFVFQIFSFEVDAYMYIQKTFFLRSCQHFCYDKASELKFAELAVHFYTKTKKIRFKDLFSLLRYLVLKLMHTYVQKMFF